MDTFEQAIQSMQKVKAPLWWLSNGANKVGQNLDERDMDKSIQELREMLDLLPAGSYKLECSNNPKDRSGSFKYLFVKGSVAKNEMTNNNINFNPYGISDQAHKAIMDEARYKVKVEMLVEKMDRFLEEWPEYKKKIDSLNDDEDGDGIPDFVEGAKKLSEVVNIGKNMKSVFD